MTSTPTAPVAMLNVEDIQEIFRFGNRKVANRFIVAHQATLGAFKVGQTWRVPHSGVDAYIRQAQGAATTSPAPIEPADGRARRAPRRQARAA